MFSFKKRQCSEMHMIGIIIKTQDSFVFAVGSFGTAMHLKNL